MAHVKHRHGAAQEHAATNARNFRTFLLVAQLEGKAIGGRIAEARRNAGLTQEQVEDLATFSKRSLQDYEAGVTIPYRHMRELAAILNVDSEWLLHGDKPELPADRLTALETRGEALQQTVDEILLLLRELREQPPKPEQETS